MPIEQCIGRATPWRTAIQGFLAEVCKRILMIFVMFRTENSLEVNEINNL
jgi:hypothetical protein